MRAGCPRTKLRNSPRTLASSSERHWLLGSTRLSAVPNCQYRRPRLEPVCVTTTEKNPLPVYWSPPEPLGAGSDSGGDSIGSFWSALPLSIKNQGLRETTCKFEFCDRNRLSRKMRIADDKLMVVREWSISLSSFATGTFDCLATCLRASQKSFSNETLVLCPLIMTERLMTADFMATRSRRI